MASRNQTPEQKARDNIDAMLELTGWKLQSRKKIDSMPAPALPCGNTIPMSVLRTMSCW